MVITSPHPILSFSYLLIFIRLTFLYVFDSHQLSDVLRTCLPVLFKLLGTSAEEIQSEYRPDSPIFVPILKSLFLVSPFVQAAALEQYSRGYPSVSKKSNTLNN